MNDVLVPLEDFMLVKKQVLDQRIFYRIEGDSVIVRQSGPSKRARAFLSQYPPYIKECTDSIDHANHVIDVYE